MPPRTTARIASSSIHSPALLPSALETFELIISPAIPAHRPEKTYASRITLRERMPVSRLASALPPTASISIPSALRRLTSAGRRVRAATTKSENGSVSQ